ncbi:MAG: hypothetical protein ACKOET_16855 [Verrucomicrobiota bacterium]
MKVRARLSGVVVRVTLASLLGGCGGQDSVDTSRVEQIFASAEAVSKSAVQSAVAAVKAQDYRQAMTALQEALAEVKLTPEQKEALGDLMARTQAKVAAVAGNAGQAARDAAEAAREAADKARTSTGRALEDLGKSLQK